jgi:prophage antirepressor-like protein
VTKVLGFVNGPQAVHQHVPAGQARTYQINQSGRPSNIISEAGLYSLTSRFRRPEGVRTNRSPSRWGKHVKSTGLVGPPIS